MMNPPVRRPSIPVPIPSPVPRRTSQGAVWYVSFRDGRNPVGPVSAEMIARDIRAGRVPRHAIVARRGDRMWMNALDVPDIYTALTAV